VTGFADLVMRSNSQEGAVAAPDISGTRIERVLDTAADLLVRWGYQRVTIDEIARHAGIGKGTVYLHFRTKDALFLTVLLRAHRRMAAQIVSRMDANPAYALPAPLMRAAYLDMVADPVAKSLYLGDVEVLGRLAHEAADTLGDLAERRADALHEHLRLLQEYGCLRRDLSVDSLRYTLSAVAMGFYAIDGMPQLGARPDVTVRAHLLEHAVAAALQVPDPPTAELARLAPTIAQLYRPLIEHIDHEWRRRVR
jgi:AcrR family transcriptional regulator